METIVYLYLAVPRYHNVYHIVYLAVPRYHNVYHIAPLDLKFIEISYFAEHPTQNCMKVRRPTWSS
jgi:hypothetical protein